MRDLSVICSAFAGCRVPRSPRLCSRSACGLGGCAGGGASNSFAMAQQRHGATIAFESIDGPPPQVFDRMVGVLDSESKLRSLSIVSREGAAAYRVRSYLAAEVSHGRTTIAWVWDVYDQQPAARVAAFRRRAGRQGRPRRLGLGRRSGVAKDRAGRIERPHRHDQRDAAGRCAATAPPAPSCAARRSPARTPPASASGRSASARSATPTDNGHEFAADGS